MTSPEKRPAHSWSAHTQLRVAATEVLARAHLEPDLGLRCLLLTAVAMTLTADRGNLVGIDLLLAGLQLATRDAPADPAHPVTQAVAELTAAATWYADRLRAEGLSEDIVAGRLAGWRIYKW